MSVSIWMNTQQLADYLGLSLKAVYARVHIGKIPFTKIGGSLRFNKRDIDEWLAQNTFYPSSRARVKE